jgi:glycosyltransferase involved in cell wall biosynthesis
MKNINLMCPISQLGYGIVGKNLALSLDSISKVYLFTIGSAEVTDEEERKTIIDLASRSGGDFDINSPCLKVWHEFAMGERIGKGDLYGFPFFEVNKFDFRRKHHLESCDGVIVASDWAAEVVRRETTQKNVHVVPLGVDMKIFHPPVDETYKQEKCIFFNCGKWEKRKGHDLLLDIFKEAFPDNEDVELWMMCQNPLFREPDNQRWNNHYKQDSRVRLIDRAPTQKDLAEIMRHSTCGVFPSRSEGWNLEALEMLAMGKELIITDYGAHKEFCTQENSYPIAPNGMEAMFDGVFFREDIGSEWVDLSKIKDSFIAAMREVYDKWRKNEQAIPLNIAGIQTAQMLNWSSTANSILEILEGGSHHNE